MGIHGAIRHEGSERTDSLIRVSLKSVIFDDQGRLLVVKEAGRDWWDLPGGGLDHGESIQQALARELFEEVSLTGDFQYQTILAEDPRFLKDHNLYQMRITFLVSPRHMIFAPGEDADEIQFIDPETFRDSSILTERRIYEYGTLAKS